MLGLQVTETYSLMVLDAGGSESAPRARTEVLQAAWCRVSRPPGLWVLGPPEPHLSPLWRVSCLPGGSSVSVFPRGPSHQLRPAHGSGGFWSYFTPGGLWVSGVLFRSRLWSPLALLRLPGVFGSFLRMPVRPRGFQRFFLSLPLFVEASPLDPPPASGRWHRAPSSSCLLPVSQGPSRKAVTATNPRGVFGVWLRLV